MLQKRNETNSVDRKSRFAISAKMKVNVSSTLPKTKEKIKDRFYSVVSSSGKKKLDRTWKDAIINDGLYFSIAISMHWKESGRFLRW